MLFRKIEFDRTDVTDNFTATHKKLLEQKDLIEKQFASFVKDATKPMLEAEKLVLEKLDTDPATLEQTMGICLSYAFTINKLINDTKQFLSIFDILHHEFKQKDLSDPDRKSLIQYRNRSIHYLLNTLKNLSEKLERRISIAQSSLKAEIAMLERSGYADAAGSV